jgi:NADH-quinone oxidoreductase subunit M
LINKFYFDLWEIQCVEYHQWIPSLGISYSLGIDGFSLPLIILTCFMTFLVIISTKESITKNIPLYYSSFLIMQGLIVGMFASLDSILFYVFFESMLIPMFLIIGVWGGKNRIYATIKFFIYTFFGSVFLLVSIIYLHILSLEQNYSLGLSFDISTFHGLY